MNVEERLPEALRESLSSIQPSPDLADRVVERLDEPLRSIRPARFRLAGAGVALTAFVALAVVFALRGGWLPGPAAGPAASGPAAASGGLSRFDQGGLAFDYPASWRVVRSGVQSHYATVIAYLGTGTGSAACQSVAPGPDSPYYNSGVICDTDRLPAAGQVRVTIERSDGPPRPGPIDPTDATALGPGDRYVTVGGMPGVYHELPSANTDALTMSWTLSVPGELISRFGISVQIVGPGVDSMRAQVDAMVASVVYDPPAPVLDPADGPRIAALALPQLRQWEPGFECFPSEPGATATATVTELPSDTQLTKPLPVMCSIAVEPSYIGLWKMTLTETWTAASDRAAGSLVTYAWIDADGVPGQVGGGPSTDIPYLPGASPS